jgi:NAD(P)-dependent dehydrogenase (short-subunit alcohol dehydrogenase family)
MSWSEHTALVTGASRGLGRAIARRLAREGAAVCVNYVARCAEAEALVNEIRAAGGRAIAVRTDVGDPAQVEKMMGVIQAELGPVSILVNNAAVIYRATLETFDPAGMERMRRTNVDGLIYVTRAAMPGMKERRYGRIVNLGSVAGHGTSLPGSAFYAATRPTWLRRAGRMKNTPGSSRLSRSTPCLAGWEIQRISLTLWRSWRRRNQASSPHR